MKKSLISLVLIMFLSCNNNNPDKNFKDAELNQGPDTVVMKKDTNSLRSKQDNIDSIMKKPEDEEIDYEHLLVPIPK